MRNNKYFALFLTLALAFGGCSSETGGNGDPDADGSPVPDADGGPGPDKDGGGDEDPPPADIPICETQTIGSGTVPANLMLVVDNSGSMDFPTSAGTTRKKIEDAKDALNMLLNQNRGEIRFGWAVFPTDDECAPGTVLIPCGDDTVDQILPLVNALVPEGGTPTGESLETARADQSLHNEARSNYILLLTDGVPTCPNGSGRVPNDADNMLALNALTSAAGENIQTFVIGLGEDLNNTDPDLLNQMAIAGGRPRQGPLKYYPANSLTELQQAFADIGGLVLGCGLVLDIVPEDTNRLFVKFNGVEVPRDYDRINGWDYEETSNQILFFGVYCDQLRTGQVDTLEIEAACPQPD
jgi:hypothetical protein